MGRSSTECFVIEFVIAYGSSFVCLCSVFHPFFLFRGNIGSSVQCTQLLADHLQDQVWFRKRSNICKCNLSQRKHEAFALGFQK